MAKVSKENLIKCNFAQFFHQPKEEKYVLIILDAYLQGKIKATTNIGRAGKYIGSRGAKTNNISPEEMVPSNVFNSEEEYEYFIKLYMAWKEQDLKSRLIIRQHGYDKESNLSDNSQNQGQRWNSTLGPPSKADSNSSFSSNRKSNISRNGSSAFTQNIRQSRSGFFGQSNIDTSNSDSNSTKMVSVNKNAKSSSNLGSNNIGSNNMMDE